MWRRVVPALCTAALAAALFAWRSHSRPEPLVLNIVPGRLSADGVSWAALGPRAASFQIIAGTRHGRIEGARLYTGVLPGRIVIEARAPGSAPARAAVETELAPADSAGDGTPDFLRLSDPADRRAFTRWFTLLAESQYYAAELPREISDCAALVRFAYREALREHEGQWASAPDVRKYRYPFTPLGAALFRVAPGVFTPADLNSGAFAEFADARTLAGRNCHFISRDLGRARPGDLLLYRQLEPGPAHFIVYHTGPIGKDPGEIRRPSGEELKRHPSPRWRPLAGNSNFLGVFRWNILRDEG